MINFAMVFYFIILNSSTNILIFWLDIDKILFSMETLKLVKLFEIQ